MMTEGVAEAPATHIWGWAWEAKLSPCLLYITTEKEELWHEKRKVGGCKEAENHTTGLPARWQQLYGQDAPPVTIKGTF